MIVLLILILHLICITIAWWAGKQNQLYVNHRLIPVLFWLPVLGELCIVVIDLCYRFHCMNGRELGVEKLREMDERHRNLFQQEGLKDDQVVPAEEAFLIDHAKMRRELILDLLKKNPEQYVELLQKARTNDDVDVVHYAATAIMELNNDYDIRLQELERAYSKNPEDQRLLEEYIDVLDSYIQHELVEGRRMQLIRNQFSQLLKKKLDHRSDLETCERLVCNELALKNYGEAYRQIQDMKQRWPGREQPWLLEIRYYAEQKKGGEIHRIIQEMKARSLYLSAAGKEVVRFWDSSDNN